MQIVIEIDEERYKDILRIADVQLESKRFKTGEQIIAKGTPLPKGHGRLIDADKAKETIMYEMCGTGYQGKAMRVLDSEFYTPTIIEADKE